MANLNLIPISGNIIPVDETYTVMVIQIGDTYECYGARHDELGSTPFMFMFGEPCDQTSFAEAVDLAVANVPLYDNVFTGEE